MSDCNNDTTTHGASKPGTEEVKSNSEVIGWYFYRFLKSARLNQFYTVQIDSVGLNMGLSE